MLKLWLVMFKSYNLSAAMIMTTLNSAAIDKDGGIGYYKNNQINRENIDWFFFLYPWLGFITEVIPIY